MRPQNSRQLIVTCFWLANHSSSCGVPKKLPGIELVLFVKAKNCANGCGWYPPTHLSRPLSTYKCLLTVNYLINKKAQLSPTNPRDAKACQKLLQFDVLTTSSLTIPAYLHSFSCCCVRNLRNPAKFTENSNLWSSRSSKVIDLGVSRKPTYDFLLVINSNFSRICYRFRDIHG